jgi:acyl carrier protein
MDADLILVEITRMLTEVIGEDYMFDVEVTMDTAFSGDLELESIEFVALAGLMKEHWGARVDFVGFLADKDLHEIIALRVGQLVDYIGQCLEAVGSHG